MERNVEEHASECTVTACSTIKKVTPSGVNATNVHALYEVSERCYQLSIRVTDYMAAGAMSVVLGGCIEMVGTLTSTCLGIIPILGGLFLFYSARVTHKQYKRAEEEYEAVLADWGKYLALIVNG